MQTQKQVLTFLMKSANKQLPVKDIVEATMLSTDSVELAIQQLKQNGHQINGDKVVGFYYQPTDTLSVDNIAVFIQKKPNQLHITLPKKSKSTMTDAKNLADTFPEQDLLVVADMQERPVGRFNRPFFAKKQAGIYMSLLLRPNQSFDEMAQYTIIAAVAVAQTIDQLAHVSTDIKWVNDIYLNGKKICGILTEAVANIDIDQVSSVIIGFGLNFSIKQSEFPAELRSKATSIFAHSEPTFTRNRLIAEIIQNFYRLLNEVPFETVLKIYRQKSFVLNKQITFMQNKQYFIGIAQAIDEKGSLIVQLSNGTFKTISSGEISLSSIEQVRNVGD